MSVRIEIPYMEWMKNNKSGTVDLPMQKRIIQSLAFPFLIISRQWFSWFLRMFRTYFNEFETFTWQLYNTWMLQCKALLVPPQQNHQDSLFQGIEAQDSTLELVKGKMRYSKLLHEDNIDPPFIIHHCLVLWPRLAMFKSLGFVKGMYICTAPLMPRWLKRKYGDWHENGALKKMHHQLSLSKWYTLIQEQTFNDRLNRI